MLKDNKMIFYVIKDYNNRNISEELTINYRIDIENKSENNKKILIFLFPSCIVMKIFMDVEKIINM